MCNQSPLLNVSLLTNRICKNNEMSCLTLDCDFYLAQCLFLSCWLTLRETSYLPRCELPSAEAHMAKKWGRPQGNSQWGTEALTPIGRGTEYCQQLCAGAWQQILPSWALSWLQPWYPDHSLERPWTRSVQWSQAQSLTNQRDWVINTCCFKPLSFGGNLLWSNTAMNWGI